MNLINTAAVAVAFSGGAAWAHSNSVGFQITPSAVTTCVGGGGTTCFDVEIFYGSWHTGSLSALGQLALFYQLPGGGETQVVGPSVSGSTPFSMSHSLIGTIPNNQLIGDNYAVVGSAAHNNLLTVFTPGMDYFYSPGPMDAPLVAIPTLTTNDVVSHQSAIGTGLGPGTYRINYDAIEFPTSAIWAPTTSVQTALLTVTEGGGVVVDTGGPPNVSLAGPTGGASGPFTVTATFSEDVTGVDTGDFDITNGTISNLVEVSPSVYTFTITPTAAAFPGGVEISIPAGGAIDDDSNPNTASNVLNVGISAAPASVVEEQINDVIQVEELKTVREQLHINRRMARGARDRLVLQMRCSTLEEEDLTSEELLECSNLWKRSVVPLDATGSLVVSHSRAMLNGSFFGQIGKQGGSERRLAFGEFNITDDKDNGLIATLNGRFAWESMVSDDTLFGYFVGGEISKSDVQGTFNGDRNRLGFSAGVYSAKELDRGLLADGFLTLGVGHNTLDITDGAVVIDGDYTAMSLQVGGAISGEREYEKFELRPELAFSLGYTEIGDVDYAAFASGISTNGAFTGDHVSLGLISFTPELLFPMKHKSEIYDTGTFRIAPSIMCDWIDSGISTNECGAALELEVSASSANGLREVSGHVRTEVVGSNTRNTFSLSLDHKF